MRITTSILALLLVTPGTFAHAQEPRLEVPPDPENGLATLGYSLQLTKKLRECAPWHTSVESALRDARRDEKLVMTFVVADAGQRLITGHECLLVETALLEPEIRSLLLDHFVLLRVSTSPGSHLRQVAQPDDPLRPLGTDLLEARSPALVISTHRGERVAMLASIGTWSRQLFVSFLQAGRGTSLEHSPRTLVERFRIASLEGQHALVLELGKQLKAADAMDDPADLVRYGVSLLGLGLPSQAHEWFQSIEDAAGAIASAVRYWDGVALARLGRHDEALESWLDVRRSTGDAAPWGLRAELRAFWHETIEGMSAARPTRFRPELASTESPRSEDDEPSILRGAIEFLLAAQRSDGRFAHASNPKYDAAITALAGGALDRCHGTFDAKLDDRIAAAVRRAAAWTRGWIDRASKTPTTADCWGAAYVLEFLASIAGEHPDARDSAPKAIALLFSTQLENGAWSYDFRFGDGWRGGFGGWPKTSKGRAHSINTAIALWAAARASEAGFDLPQEPLRKGLASMLAMREGDATFTYTWPEPRSFERPRQSLGRAAVSLQALVSFDRAQPEALELAIEEFVSNHEKLHVTRKLTSAWIGPGNTSSYFFLHSFFHAADAIESLGGEAGAGRLRLLRNELLRRLECDGTWVDYEHSGKVYGTAMAVAVLARARAAR